MLLAKMFGVLCNKQFFHISINVHITKHKGYNFQLSNVRIYEIAKKFINKKETSFSTKKQATNTVIL